MSNIFNRYFYTENEKYLYETLAALSADLGIIRENLPNILMRVKTLSSADNIDTFVLATCANSQDALTYTSNTDLVDLLIKDCGLF